MQRMTKGEGRAEVRVDSSFGDCMAACAWYANRLSSFSLIFALCRCTPLHSRGLVFLDYVPNHQFFCLYPLEVGAAYSRL